MAGPVLDFDPLAADRSALPAGDTRKAPTLLEQAGASMRSAADEEEHVQAYRSDMAYNELVEALVERGARKRDFAPDFGAQLLDQINPFATSTIWDPAKVWAAAKRAGLEGLPETREQFERDFLSRQGRSQADDALMARGEGALSVVAQFAGAAPTMVLDPVNLAGAAIPGGAAVSLTRKALIGATSNALIEAVQIPGAIDARAALGKETGLWDIALRVGAAGTFGGALPVAGAGMKALDDAAYSAAAPLRDAIDAQLSDRDLARAFAQLVPENLRTPEQEAALVALTRSIDIDEASPYVRTYEGFETHAGKLEEAMAALEEGRISAEAELVEAVRQAPVAGVTSETPRAPVGARADFGEVKALIRGPESGGNDAAVNGLGSSASGRYQFIEGTFKRLYAKEFGGGDRAAARAWATKRFDGAVQERLMDRLLSENAAAIERAGFTADAGNLYLAHFAGAGKAVDLLRAPREAPVADYFSAEAIRQNPGYLGGGKSVGEAIDIVRGKVGGSAGAPRANPVPYADEGPLLRPDALDAERPSVAVDGRMIETAAFSAEEIGVDAELMQFKSGGDQFGVTERLQGIEEWDPIAAGMVTVWEGADGRRLIADGHQRLGLARRISAARGEEIRLNAFVLREEDGFSAVDARILTALKNIGEGTGTATDAAKVFRDVGIDSEAAIRRLPPRSALVRDGKALARLEQEAFGAIVNEVIPENYGAAVGALVEDPALHMAMVRILAETDPPNRVQAEAIVRQAKEAGFTRETQDSLFGSEDLVTGLFAQRAKVLDRALRELRKMKGAFGVAVRNAETLEAGGNRIDVAGSTAAADANAQALALVDALALRKGNAVNELLDQAARRVADGEPLARVLKDFVAAVSKLDLQSVAREAGSAGRDGDGAGGSGRAGEPEIAARLDSEELSPRESDEARAAGETTAPLFDDEAGALFDTAAGDGAARAAESAWHDIRAQDDFAAPTSAQARRALELKTEGRQKGTAPQKAAGEDGGLFDTQDTTGDLFDLGDGRGARSAAEIRAELDAERAGLEEIRKCLK